jgi:hypothetical protein
MQKLRLSTFIFLSAAACGGQAANVNGSSGGDDDNNESGGPVIVSSGSSGTTTGASGTPSSTGASGSTSAGTPGGGGTAGAGGTTTNPEDGGPAHLALPLITATACGTATCTSTQECCVSLGLGRNGTTTVACKDTCTGASIAATCSSAASCTGAQVCCASLDLGGGFGGGRDAGLASASCEDSCAQADAGRLALAIQLCSTDAECPTGEVCRADDLGLDSCAEAPPVFDRDAGLRTFGDGGILRLFDAGIGELFDGGGRRRIRDAGRD